MQTISIHAPREGGDILITRTIVQPITFQSTPPARGATLCNDKNTQIFIISIHAPREGGDVILWPLCLPV